MLIALTRLLECGRSSKEARALDRGSPLVFASVRGKPMATTALSELLRELEIAAVPHGFRSSFRDWAADETDHPREVVEAPCECSSSTHSRVASSMSSHRRDEVSNAQIVQSIIERGIE